MRRKSYNHRTAHAIELIDDLVKNKKYLDAEAITAACLLLTEDPDDLVIQLARIYEETGEFKKTLQSTIWLSKHFPQNIEIYYQHAYALRAFGRSDEAAEILLPWIATAQSKKIMRLYGMTLADIGLAREAEKIWEQILIDNPDDEHTARIFFRHCIDQGLHGQALELYETIPKERRCAADDIGASLTMRQIGEVGRSIEMVNAIKKRYPEQSDALWVQCFNYSISSAIHAENLIKDASAYWEQKSLPETQGSDSNGITVGQPREIRIGLLSGDIGDHVVARFIAPILRNYDRNKFHIEILVTTRRYEEKRMTFSPNAKA
jgi:tetratricopeptide (TPR) repeat protein